MGYFLHLSIINGKKYNKKMYNMSKTTFQKAELLVVVMLLSCVCCNAQPGRCNTSVSQCDSLVEETDSVKEAAVGCRDSSNRKCVNPIVEQDTLKCPNIPIDSITNIISHFKRVEYELQGKNPQDTVRVITKKVLPRKYNEVLRYILLDDDNYKTNDIVFGLFSSSIKYKIIQSRRKYVYAEFDFGLRKWQILDSNSEVLFQGDIKENNLQMLRFSRLIFPDDVTLKILQDNLKAL